MKIEIRKAVPEDAAELLDFLRLAGGETDNLTFGKEGVPFTVDDEMKYLQSLSDSNVSALFIAKIGDEIVGEASFSSCSADRLKHIGELGICVKKSRWGSGVGSKLMETVINFAKYDAKAEIITLNVRSDNMRAIKLYEKYGFKKFGCFKGYFKINNSLIDCDYMNLYL